MDKALATPLTEAIALKDGSRLVQILVAAQNARPEQLKRTVNGLINVDGPLKEFIGGTFEVYKAATVESRAFIYGNAFNALGQAFIGSESTWLVPVLRYAASVLVRLAFAEDARTRGQSISDAARLLNKCLTIASSDKGSQLGSKRAIVLHLANLSFKCYFHLQKIRLCETVIKNAQNSAIDLDQCTRADRVAYQYYLGKIYLYQHKIRKAYDELFSAFVLCTSRHWKNRRLILNYLTVAGLLSGTFPHQALLQHFKLDHIFVPLILNTDRGDYGNALKHLEKTRSYHLNRGTYLLLREKLPVQLWRNLFRQTLLISRADAAPDSTPTLDMSLLLLALQWSMQDQTLTLLDVECISASLIDAGYLKAYIFHAKSLLVFQKGPQLGFTPVHLVRRDLE